MVEIDEDFEDEDFEELSVVDFDNRSIYLFGSIDTETAKIICRALLQLDKIDGPITIYINSDGGEVHSMTSIISFIESCKNEVNCDIVGAAFSAAAYIAMCCDNRRISRYGVMMMHPFSAGMSQNKIKDLENSVLLLGELHERILKEVLKRTKLSYSQYSKKTEKTDWYIFPETCKKLGLVDEIF